MGWRNGSELRGAFILCKKSFLKLAVFKWLYATNFKEVGLILKKGGLGRGEDNKLSKI